MAFGDGVCAASNDATMCVEKPRLSLDDLLQFQAGMGAMVTSDWILLFTRVVTGVVLVYYGLPKCRDLRSCARDFEGMGFRPGVLWGTLIAVIEFFGGLAMLAGLYAELAASLFGFQMIVGTFWKLKIKKPFTDYSYDLLLLALCVMLMGFGAGRYAPARFDATVFLRWGIIPIVILLGAAFAYLSKPSLPAADRGE